ncbi:MAG TPA: dihydrodipicolinate synthase family protein [Cyclobacteriaceae bacterium]|nr:dihydrodipicolinate synthase family protein [Cyclobacteriaceae bacterium]
MSSITTLLPDGVFAASVTPLNKDYTINLKALAKHCHWLLENGNDGICFMGTTGEANSFSVTERIAALDHVLSSGIDSKKLLVGTGCCSLGDTIALTRHAMNNKVGGVLVLPPFYYKQVSDAGLMEYFETLISRVDSSDLKIYLYHFPKMTGVPYTVEFVNQLVSRFPNTVVGMKDSGGDWANMEAVMKSIPGFKLYSGTEKFLLHVLRAGGAGCISATTNVTGRIAAKVFERWKSTDAKELQEQLTAARAAFEVASFIGGVKGVLAKYHKDDDWLNICPPNSPLSADVMGKLEQNLRSVDLGLT